MTNEEVLHQGPPISKASKALIILHGRGGTAQGIMNLADSFSTPQLYIAAPQASHQTWYPHSFMIEENLNEPYLSSSVEVVKRLIDTISASIPLSQTYLMGFSQGACLALEVAARFATKYGGVIAFTGGLIGSVINKKKYHGDFKGTPIFIGTSDQDPHVPLERAQESKIFLEELGAHVTLKVYPGMGHTINEDEILWVKKNIFLL